MTGKKKIKRRVFEIIEKADGNDLASKVFDYSILILITLNVIAVVLESFNYISTSYYFELKIFETISVIIFTIEYTLRLWTADIKYEKQMKKSLLKPRVRYMCSFMAIVDLVAVLPFYLPMLITVDLRFLRMIRISRMMRIFKYNRYSKALNLITKVIKDKVEELIATIFIMCFLILIASTLIYYIESEVQPEAFPNIVASFWWAVATLTTVGYGDVYPITAMGKFLAGIIAILGIGFVALPTGIISSGFMDEITKKDDIIVCPHCKKVISDEIQIIEDISKHIN